MTTPPFLKQGDKIGIVAPARKVSREEIIPAVDLFKAWGLIPVLGNNLFGNENQFSGSDIQREKDLQNMLDDDSVRAIVAARGGYGTLRIIDKLNFRKFCKKPKWIIGYSDITVLHVHIVANFKIATLHATMPIKFNEDAESTETLRKCLFGENFNYSVSPHLLNRKGEAEGVLTGGNLSLLYALKGSKSFGSLRDKILFIEDVDEYLYHIDRMILSLKRTGLFSRLRGLVVGSMSNMKDNDIPFGKSAEEIIAEAVKEYDYPVCFGFPAGHDRKNLALPMGRRAKLQVGRTTSLLFR